MSRFLIVIIFVLILIGGLFYFLLTGESSTSTRNNITPTTAQEQNLPTPTMTEEENALRAGGSSFTDPANTFTLLYPSEYRLDTQGEGRYRITKIGATQRGQTEIYDGVVIHFETVTLDRDQTLESWVDERIKNASADGTSSVIEPKETTTLNGYQGFKYTLRGLGTFEEIVIQKDTSSQNAVVITQLVADPENIGYQKEVTTILSTLELHK